MTRAQLEAEVMEMMAMTDTSLNIIATADKRTIAQSALASALQDIAGDHKWDYLRKTFGVWFQAPNTGVTFSWTKGATSITVAGATPDNTWIGGHALPSGSDFPYLVLAVNGQALTLAQPVIKATGVNVSGAFYFDGVLLPTDFSCFKEGAFRLEGHRHLGYVTTDEMEARYGYQVYGTDYGYAHTGAMNQTISTPNVSQPLVYTIWDRVIVSGEQRAILSVYPYPDLDYAGAGPGWRKITQLAVDGTTTADSSIPDLPSEFHRTLLLPKAKLNLSSNPSYELTEGEKNVLREQVKMAMRQFFSRQRQDDNEENCSAPDPAFL